MLTDGSATNPQGMAKAFSSTGSSGIRSNVKTASSIFEDNTSPPAAENLRPTAAVAPPPVPMPASSQRQPATVEKKAAAPSTPAPSVSSGPVIVTTTVRKGPHGIGLDLTKTSNGRANIQRFKDLPDGAVNPAAQCVPAIKPGDVIIGVNGKSCATFAEVIKTIRAIDGEIILQLERAN